FYTLQEKYRNDKKLMLGDLQNDIKSSQHIKETVLYARSLLLQLANGKNVTHKDQFAFNIQPSIPKKIWYLIKTCMGLNIDTVNTNKKTPLMLAAQRGDDAVVAQLLAMNADKDKKDKDNNTALHFATRCAQGSQAAYTLLEYGARQDVYNKNNEQPIINEN